MSRMEKCIFLTIAQNRQWDVKETLRGTNKDKYVCRCHPSEARRFSELANLSRYLIQNV